MYRLAAASALLTLATLGCPATKGTTDAGNQAGTDCAAILTCLNTCTTGDCQNACESAGSTEAQGLINTLSNCLNTACPSAAATDVCASNTTACQTCASSAQEAGGTCVNQLNACASDDGVAQTLGCGGVDTCISACATTDATCQQNCFEQGTTVAQQLYNDEGNCFETACPTTGSGVCATETDACDSCYLGAQALEGQCNTAVVACDTDTSGTGSEPAVTNNGGCTALNGCLGGCSRTDLTCETGCEAAATDQALQDLEALNTCLETACPTTGICATDSMGCSTCITANSTTGGSCSTQSDTCSSD